MANKEHVARLRLGVKAWAKWRSKHPDVKVDLSGVDLNTEKLSSVNLQSADLSGAQLLKAVLRAANLREANLCDADLRGADLQRALLEEASLDRADLSHADLTKANLSKTKLHGTGIGLAVLQGATFIEADLAGLDLSGANLRYVTLKGANLNGAILARCNLSGVDLSGADCRNADLREADLSKANFRDADLTGANVAGANLAQADLTKSRVTASQLREAVGLEFLNSPDSILREIEFRPEVRDSGIAVLSYFGSYLRDKYPDQHVTVRIQQHDNRVRMEIDPPEGKREVIENDLVEYGLVVIGEKSPSEVFNDQFLILKLENQLEITKTQLHMTQRLYAQLEITNRQLEETKNQFAAIAQAAVNRRQDLDDAIRAGLHIENHIHVAAEASVSSEVIDSQLADVIAELNKGLQDADDRAVASDKIKGLASQAKLPPLRRKPKEELESDWNVLEGLAQAAGIAGSTASVWQTWGPAIARALGF